MIGPRPLKSLKPEVRVLGLDTCNNQVTIGTIVRGGLYLDGIIRMKQSGGRETWRFIRSSRYYPELRAMMIHDPDDWIDSRQIVNVSELPVVEVQTKKPRRRAHEFSKGYSLRFWANSKTLSDETLSRMIQLTWTYGSLPEPIRIAHLLAES